MCCFPVHRVLPSFDPFRRGNHRRPLSHLAPSLQLLSSAFIVGAPTLPRPGGPSRPLPPPRRRPLPCGEPVPECLCAARCAPGSQDSAEAKDAGPCPAGPTFQEAEPWCGEGHSCRPGPGQERCLRLTRSRRGEPQCRPRGPGCRSPACRRAGRRGRRSSPALWAVGRGLCGL